MEITPKDLTIGQLFANLNEQFLIPAYQRRYAWKYNQYAALFDDINKLGNTDKHLFGTVLFNSGYYKGELVTPEIVDGQQRITTLSLLILAIKNVFSELKDHDRVKEINKYIICKDYDEKNYNKLVLGDLDNPDYNKILKTKELNSIVNNNLKFAYISFYSWLKEGFSNKDLRQFYLKLTNNCVIIRLDINDAKNVYKLFEIINNRGLRLSSTDVIKNFILGHASHFGEDTLNEVKRLWADIIINLDKINTDDFLRQFLSSILRKKISESFLISEFKNYYKKRVKSSQGISDFSIENEYPEEDEDSYNSNEDENPQIKNRKIKITTFLKKIKATSKIYSKIINKSFDHQAINKSLFDLERIQSFPSNIFLLDLFSRKLELKNYYRVLEQIKAFMIRRNICEYRTGELDSIFANLCNVIDEHIEKNVSDYLKYYLPTDEEFQNYFQKHQFKGKNKARAKYVLEQIEYYLTGNKNEYVINSSEEVHLEHIMPQKITTNKSKEIYGDWENYLNVGDDYKHKQYVWRIGNLTLLSDELNLGASNNPFIRKKNFYKQSSLQLNKEIVQSYRQFKFKDQERRSRYFANLAVKIWKL